MIERLKTTEMKRQTYYLSNEAQTSTDLKYNESYSIFSDRYVLRYFPSDPCFSRVAQNYTFH